MNAQVLHRNGHMQSSADSWRASFLKKVRGPSFLVPPRIPKLGPHRTGRNIELNGLGPLRAYDFDGKSEFFYRCLISRRIHAFRLHTCLASRTSVSCKSASSCSFWLDAEIYERTGLAQEWAYAVERRFLARQFLEESSGAKFFAATQNPKTWPP